MTISANNYSPCQAAGTICHHESSHLHQYTSNICVLKIQNICIMQKNHMHCVDADKLCYRISIMTRGGIDGEI